VRDPARANNLKIQLTSVSHCVAVQRESHRRDARLPGRPVTIVEIVDRSK